MRRCVLALGSLAVACNDLSVPTDVTDMQRDSLSEAAADGSAPDAAGAVDSAADTAAEVAVDVSFDAAPRDRVEVAMDAAPGDGVEVAVEVALSDRSDAVAPEVPAPDAVVPDGTALPPSRVPVTMFHYDLGHTGANRQERALSPAALRAGRLYRDPAFAPSLDGDVYGQPLYLPAFVVAGAVHDVLFVGTQANSLYALDAHTGATLWRRTLAPAVPLVRMPCGNIGPTTGLVSTPVIDPVEQTLYAVAYNSLDGGYTRRFTLHVLDLHTGEHRPGRDAVLLPPTTNGSTWEPGSLGQRGALTFVDGRVYVPFGGLYNDCSVYHGWVLGVDARRTLDQRAFATPGVGAGIWSVGGVAADGAGHVFVTTGNGRSPASMGEYVLRLGTRPVGPTFSGRTTDYFTPSNRDYMDVSDSDLGTISPVVLPEHRGSRTPHLLFQGSKHGQGYLLNRDDLGGQGRVRTGIDEAVFSEGMYAGGLYGAAAAWSDGREVYVFAPGRGARAHGCPTGVGGITTLRLTLRDGVSQFRAVWCTASIANPSAPTVSSNGDANGLLWVTGVAPPELRAYDIASGEEVFASRGADAPATVRQWTPPVVVDGSVYVTGYATLYRYRLR